jgi:hypothetical protein
LFTRNEKCEKLKTSKGRTPRDRNKKPNQKEKIKI